MPTRTVHLRAWQQAAHEAMARSEQADFLAVATPGAGKTTFALTAAVRDLAEHPHRRLVVVVPTQQLKHQWTRAAARLDVHLEPTWAARHGALPGDMHGIVVTYQQVAAHPEAVRRVAEGAFVVFDEVHHAGEERSWGDAIRHAFAGAARRLSLSGTPFRSDAVPIPFVTYDHDEEARPDYEYGYGEALRDRGVVRAVYFPRVDGQMEWRAPDGSEHEATFGDALDATRSAQRLRTALSLDGEWLPAVLVRAHAQLEVVRRAHPSAAGLVIATDQDHARGVVRLLRRRCGVDATLVLSDDRGAAARISDFAEGTDPWIVAVRMVSEGVDIPRLRVGVYATTTTTELFFRQATGRLVRWTRGLRDQRCWFFIPDDPRLRRYADEIAQQRRHNLRRRVDDEGGEDAWPQPDDDPLAAEEAAEADHDQLSLFAVLSAVALGEPVLPDGAGDGPDGGSDDEVDDELVGFAVELAAPPRPGAATLAALAVDGLPPPGSLREHKARLRDLNAERVRTLARLTGQTHAQVNGELNRRAGVGRVSEATADQLARRLRHADHWINRL